MKDLFYLFIIGLLLLFIIFNYIKNEKFNFTGEKNLGNNIGKDNEFESLEKSNLPNEIKELEKSILSIKGISGVYIEKWYTPDISVKDLKLPGEYANLPIATLRRTNGGLDNELLVSIRFEIDRNESGLKALEFLSWIVRDLSRSDENIQIRSIGLPPNIGGETQLGETLKFSIDIFYISKDENINSILEYLLLLSKDINEYYSDIRNLF